MPAHLSFWRNRHAELHGIETDGPLSDTTEPEAEQQHHTATPKSASTTPTSTSTAPSFADPVRKCCLLCSRQFKTEAEIDKHNAASQLHRTNLRKPDLVAQARAKLAKASADPASSAEYRDRASERRRAFNQPKQPTSEPKAKATVSAATEASAAPSKGAALLGKMGWSEGAGLGAQGTGMVAPVATDMYVQGVGLGAQGGKVGDAAKEAERNTRGGYEGFAERTREGAKQRFERMS